MKPFKALLILLTLSVSLTGFSFNSDQGENSIVEKITNVDVSSLGTIELKNTFQMIITKDKDVSIELNGCSYIAERIAMPLPLKNPVNSQGVVNHSQFRLDKDKILTDDEFLFGSLTFLSSPYNPNYSSVSGKMSSRDIPISDDDFDLSLNISLDIPHSFNDVFFDKLNLYGGFPEFFTKKVYFSGYKLKLKK